MNFLLLHGSWHGAWCWHKIVPRLAAAGHCATAIDLPGRGRKPAWAAAVGMKRMLKAAAAALPASQKTTVVVHSRNGIVASELAEAFPDRIDRTIYLAAFMLRSGERVVDHQPDPGSLIGKWVEINRFALSDRLNPKAYREGLYADCSEDDVSLAQALLVPEPSRPALARLSLSAGRYDRVPRAYIRLTQDSAVSLALQDRLLSKTKVDRVESIDASHSAYFSRPDDLASTILKLAAP